MSEIKSRKSWDQYFIDMAVAAATMSTCPRLSVGAVIVRNKRIISTGFNGAPSNAKHCIDEGCVIENDHCIATVHAETNAIDWAAKAGQSLEYGVIYITHNPCLDCFKNIVSAGIKRIVYKDLYKDVDYSKLRISTNTMPEIIKLNS